MRKLISLLFIYLISASVIYATPIDKVIAKSNINKSAVSVSVKDVKTGKVVYQYNAKRPVQPASTLKVVTLAAVVNELGDDYEFHTKLYKNANNELIFQLGADPFLTYNNLKNMLKTAKQKGISTPPAIKIDDSIIDNVEWGEGWQWDDSLNPLMPKFSAYNLDKNLLKITVEPTILGSPANIKLEKFYPVTFMNLVTTGKHTDVELAQNNISVNVLTLTGTVGEEQKILLLPVNNTKQYFLMRINDGLNSAKIKYYGSFLKVKLPKSGLYLISEVKNPVEKAYFEVLKNSDNMIAETLFKIAGGHFASATGSFENGKSMLYKYFEQIGIDTEDIKIVDASGVSKNNIVTSDFMSEFLLKQNEKNPKYKDLFATAGEGTLQNRMLYFKGNLKAKTGTLSDVSAIAGFITSASGKEYVFDITIVDAKSKSYEKKIVEEYILREIYSSY